MENLPPQRDSTKSQALLLDCLEHIALWHGMPFQSDASLAGLPVDEYGVGPEALLRVAARSGLQASFVKQPLAWFNAENTPAIVLLKGNRAGVLLPVNGQPVFYGATDNGFERCDEALLKQQYLGFAILVNPLIEPHSAAVVGQDFSNATERGQWFWRTLWQFRSYYLQLLPAALMLNLFALAMPFFVMIVYDRVVPNEAVETLWVLALGVALVFAFDFIMRVVRGAVLERAGREMDFVLGGLLFEQVMALSMRAIPSSTGNLVSRLRAYETLREFFVSATMLAITDLPFSIVLFAVVFYLGGSVGWVLVIAAALAILCGLLLQLPLHRSVNAAAEAGLERQAFMAESVANLEAVKTLTAQGYMQRKMNQMLRASSRHSVQAHWYGLLGNSWTTAIMHMTSVVVVVACVYRVQAGLLTMGGMIAVVMLTSRCMAPLAMVSGLMTRLQQALQSLRSLNGVMQLEREAPEGRQYQQLNIADGKTDYFFDRVNINYPAQDHPALSALNLRIGQGEKVALLGRIGSGKSTLLKAMAGLYSASAGKIHIGGVDMSQYHPVTIRQLVGYVPQDAVLFHGSLRENITVGVQGYDDTAISRAVRLAGLAEFVNRHPHGINAEVGERGSLLSGGQRRAVVLARCLVRTPAMYLLDEPTANLDPATEKLVVDNLREIAASAQHTLIVATHKPAVLDIMDRAIVLDQGRVVKDGPVDQVLSQLRQAKPTRASYRKKNQPAVEQQPELQHG